MKLSKISTRGDDKYAGIEPTWTNQQGTKSELMSALNWYNYFCTKKDAKTFVLEYMQMNSTSKDDVSYMSTIPDSEMNMQFGFIARMASLGYKPDEDTQKFFDQEMAEYLIKGKFNRANKIVEKKETPQVVNIQDRINEKANEEVAELEGLVDDQIVSKFKNSIDIAKYLKSRNLSSVIAKRISDYFVDRSKQFENEINDSELREGYSNFTKPELKKLKDFFDGIVSESFRLMGENKPTRKRRKVKEKPATVLVSKMNYMQEFPELNLKSIQPEKIIGAMQVWTYNSKTKLLGVYNADNARGITVKGSSLQNFNAETSIGKRLRKPEVVLPDLIDAGKIRIKKILPELTTKESNLTGRMNSDTLIVRIL